MFASKKHAMLFLPFVLIAVFIVLSLLHNKALVSGYLEKELVLTQEALLSAPKDFRIEQNSLRSESNDPWLDVQIPNGVYSRIEIHVEQLSKPATTCQVYFGFFPLEKYKEGNSALIELREGENTVLLPEKRINRLRIDLTNEDQVEIALGEVSATQRIDVISPWKALLYATAIVVGLFLMLRLTGWVAAHPAETEEKLSRLVQDKPKLVLTAAFSLALLICFWDYLVGNRYFAYLDIGSDTVFVYQPIYFAISDDFSANRFAEWTFNFGLGTSTLNYLAMLADPFTWVTLLEYSLFGFHAAEISVAWMQALKLLLCALICYDFLNEFRIEKTANILTSFIYGFCGFAVVWGQHYQFATAFVIFSLFMLTIERAVKETRLSRKHARLALVIAWMVGKSYYFGYMGLLIAVIYVLIRLFTLYPLKALRAWIPAGALIVASVLIGIVASCALFLPQIYEILTVSDRIDQSFDFSASLRFAPKEQIRTILCRYLSDDLEGIKVYSGYANYYEAEQLFFSSFFVYFSAVYVALGRAKGKKAFLLRLIGVVILLVAPMVLATGVIFNGFVAPVGRYTFVLMPFFAVITAKALEGIFEKRLNWRELALLSLVFVPFLLAPNLKNSTIRLLYASIVSECVFFVVTLVLFTKSGRRNQLLRNLMIAVIVLNVGIDTWISTNHRASLSDTYTKEDVQYMTEAAKSVNESLYLASPELFRVEKSFTDYSWFNDAMVEDYYGVSSYNSTVNSKIKNFYKNCWEEVIFNDNPSYIQFELDRDGAEKAALLGVRYLIADRDTDELPGYRYIGSRQGRYLYENEYYEGFGRFFTETVSYDEFSVSQDEEKDQLLQTRLILDEAVTLPEAEATVSFALPESDDHVEGTVVSDGEGFLFLPIPYENGWTTKVNGEPVEPLLADYGFMALPIEAGESSIELSFEIPLFKQGIMISAIGLLVILGMSITANRYTKKNKKG